MADIEGMRLREIADTINGLHAEIARLRSLVAALIAANEEKDEALRVLIEDRAPRQNGRNDWYIPPVTSAS